MKNPGFLWLLLLAQLVSCQFSVERTPTVLNKKHQIKIDDCGASFNGQPLPFGVPLDTWEKILGKSIHRGKARLWDSLGIGVIQTRINQKNPNDPGDLVVEKLLVFFQNDDDFRPQMFYPVSPETYPKKTFKDAISINGALLSRGMGFSEIQDRLDETGASGKLKINSKVRRGTDPYRDDGVPGEYTRPPLTFCEGRRFIYNFHIARIEPIVDEERFWETLEDYEKGNAIEVFEMWEYSAQDYFESGRDKLLKGLENNDEQLLKKAKQILTRAIEKGSEEAKIFLKEQNLHE